MVRKIANMLSIRMMVMAVLLSRVGFLFPLYVKAFGRPKGVMEKRMGLSA
jgi:hypothetical protein